MHFLEDRGLLSVDALYRPNYWHRKHAFDAPLHSYKDILVKYTYGQSLIDANDKLHTSID